MTKTVLYNCNAVTRNAADDRNCELCKYFLIAWILDYVKRRFSLSKVGV